MDRISGEDIAHMWHEDSGSGSEHDEAPANMIDFFPADEAQAVIDELMKHKVEMQKRIDALEYALSGYDKLHPLLSKGE